jgi:selenium metabolism protein YedF
MKKIVDARGLTSPQPVIETKKALESNDEVITIVDNQSALENIVRMAKNIGCVIDSSKKDDGIYITLKKSGTHYPSPSDTSDSSGYSWAPAGTRVLVFSQDVMGRGDDDLGRILIKSLFHTLAETKPAPDSMIFFNTGVKLVADGSEVIDDIRLLEKNGVRVLACGTCLDYFKIKDRLAAGTVSNMYEIKELMLTASSTVTV